MLLHDVLGCKENICNMQHTIFLSTSLVVVSSYNVLQRLPLSTDREFETDSLSYVNGYAKLGKYFISASQALIGFSGCCAFVFYKSIILFWNDNHSISQTDY